MNWEPLSKTKLRELKREFGANKDYEVENEEGLRMRVRHDVDLPDKPPFGWKSNPTKIRAVDPELLEHSCPLPPPKKGS